MGSVSTDNKTMIIPTSALSARQMGPPSGGSALVMASGRPVPNFIDPETRGPATPIIMAILLALVAMVLGVRIYTRCRISKSFGTDDVLIILAFIPSMAFAVLATYALFNLQWNRHAWDMIPAFRTPSFQVNLTMQILFCLGTNLTKLSMLSLIHRLVVAGKSRMHYTVKALAALITADTAVFILVDIFQCRPIHAYWTLLLKFTPGVCLDEGSHLLSAGIINTVTDLLIVLLPLPVVMRLQMPLRERWAVYALFTGGILASIAGAVRTYYTWVLSTDPWNDTTWHAYPVTLATAIELYTGLIVASLPATKPFFKRHLPQLLGTNWSQVTNSSIKPKKGHSHSPSSSSLPDKPSLASHGRSNSTTSTRSNASRDAKPRTSIFTEELLDMAEEDTQPIIRKPVPARSLTSSSNGRNYSRTDVTAKAEHGAIRNVEHAATQAANTQRMSSVYLFKPYSDGHISIVKAKAGADRARGQSYGPL